MSSSPTREGGVVADVTMPQMGVSVAEGTVIAWRVAVGDRVQAEQTICEISTDKIDTEVPAPVDGVVAEILVALEETVEVGVVLARIAPADGGAAAPSGSSAVSGPADVSGEPEQAPMTNGAQSAGGAVGSAPGTQSAGGAAGSAPGAQSTGGAMDSAPAGPRAPGAAHYSPVVQRIAAEHEVDLSTVTGTGRGGRVRKQDVLALVSGAGVGNRAGGGAGAEPPLHIESPYRPDPVTPAPTPIPAPSGGGSSSSSELSRMRRQIGAHMKRSLETAATCTTWIEVDMSGVQAARVKLRVTALAFVARATIDALREHPALNAWLDGELYTQVDEVNLGIAVSLGEDGLIVPVIQRAHELSVEGLAARIRELAQRARARQLTADDVQGATFTITNPGQYGSIMATPIINQPQVGILDLEAIVKRPVVVSDPQGNDAIAIRPMTILGLSWDHRALDGALSAQFLASVKRALESVGSA